MKSPTMTQVPEKLSRFRQAYSALKSEYDAIGGRRQRAIVQRRDQQHRIAELKAQPLGYLESGSVQEKAIKAAESVLETMIATVQQLQQHQNEIGEDLHPLSRTIRDCENHLGIHGEDDWVRSDVYTVSDYR